MLQRDVSNNKRMRHRASMSTVKEDPPERSQPPRAKLWPAAPTGAWAFFAASTLELTFKAARPRPARAATVASVFRVLDG